MGGDVEMLEDYNFVKYDHKFMDHLDRHIKGSETVGSTFRGEVQVIDIIDFAFTKMRHYNGERMVVEVDLPYVVGLEGVIALSKLPRGTEIKREKRDKKYEVNVVHGIRKRETSHLIIIVGPLKDGRHGFLSIYPGMYCPELEDREFWEKHAFIDSKV